MSNSKLLGRPCNTGRPIFILAVIALIIAIVGVVGAEDAFVAGRRS